MAQAVEIERFKSIAPPRASSLERRQNAAARMGCKSARLEPSLTSAGYLYILERLPDVTGDARLRLGLDCKSAAIAARIASGKPIGIGAWRPLRSNSH